MPCLRLSGMRALFQLLFWLPMLAQAQPVAQVTDWVLVLEGPASMGSFVQSMYGPNSTSYTYQAGPNAGKSVFVYDTLRKTAEQKIAAALDLKLLPTTITDMQGIAVPGKALMPPKGVSGGHPRSFMLGGLPNQEDPAASFAANPALTYAVLLYCKAYRVAGRGADQITNKRQQEFYEMDLRLRLIARDGTIVLDRRVDHVRWEGEKYYVKLMGKRTTETSITGNELLALFDKALTQVLRGAKIKEQ